jgi:hypothetical protein
MTRATIPALVLAVLVAASVAPATGGDEQRKKEAPEVKVYTNADLERLFGPPASPPRSEGLEFQRERFGRQALEALLADEETEPADRRARAAAIRRERLARVQYLRQKAASIRNPLLARPEPSEEDQREEAGMDSAARLERTLRQLEEAEAALAEAERSLAALGGAPGREATPPPAPRGRETPARMDGEED